MTIDLKSLVLDLASEDYTGLWELVWRANTIEPGQAQEDVIKGLRSAVADLIRDGKVALYRATAFVGDERRIPDAETEKELRTKANWQPPPVGVPHVRVVAQSG